MLLGRLMQNILTRNGFKDFENIVDIWLLKYLMKLLGIKLCILNTFNLWAYDVGLPLCYDVGDYHVFVTCDYLVFVMKSQFRAFHFAWRR